MPGFRCKNITLFSAEFTMKFETSFNNSCCFLYWQHKFWPIMASLLETKISTSQTYQLFFPYISWDQYHQKPILFMVVLFSKWPCKLKPNFHFQCKCHYRSRVLRYIMKKMMVLELRWVIISSGWVSCLLYFLCNSCH